MAKIAKYFKEKETVCHCGCESNSMDKYFLLVIDLFRFEVGPLKVNSGFRCSKHNKKIEGAKNSWHMKGQAMDLVPINKDMTIDLLEESANKYFNEVIRHDTYIHVGKPKKVEYISSVIIDSLLWNNGKIAKIQYLFDGLVKGINLVFNEDIPEEDSTKT